MRHNPTEAEARFWRALRMHQLAGVHFRRQHSLGLFIVDFCAPRRRLVVELDRSQHLEQVEYDRERTAFLAARWYRMLRFWKNAVMNELDGVVQAILDAL